MRSGEKKTHSATCLFSSLLTPHSSPRDGNTGKWRAAALGDSCLIRVRVEGQIRSFPVRKAADFGNQPRLIGSRAGPAPQPENASVSLRPDDRLFIMTDALTQWFPHTHEQGGHPGEAVSALLSAPHSDEAFAAWIEEFRKRDVLRNDDVTLIAIDLPPPPAPKE